MKKTLIPVMFALIPALLLSSCGGKKETKAVNLKV